MAKQWNNISMKAKAAFIQEAVNAGVTKMKDIQDLYEEQYNRINSYSNGGDFDSWYNTIPTDRNDTTNYRLREAYEVLPKETLERWRNATPEQLKDDRYHLPTFYWKDDNEAQFLKSKNHDTIKKELEWYNSEEGKNFKADYIYDDSTEYPRYIRRNTFGGGGFFDGAKKAFKEEFRGEDYQNRKDTPWYKRTPNHTETIGNAYKKAEIYNTVDLNDSQTVDNIILGMGAAGAIPSPASPFLLGASAVLGTTKGALDIKQALDEGNKPKAIIEAGFTFPDVIRATGTSNILQLLGPWGRGSDKVIDYMGNALLIPEAVKVNYPKDNKYDEGGPISTNPISKFELAPGLLKDVLPTAQPVSKIPEKPVKPESNPFEVWGVNLNLADVLRQKKYMEDVQEYNKAYDANLDEVLADSPYKDKKYEVVEHDVRSTLIDNFSKVKSAEVKERMATIDKEFDSLSKDTIKSYQEDFAEKGGYDDYIKGMSRSQVRNIQKRMIDKGLLSDKKNSKGAYIEADGIVGDKTIAAYRQYNVDGILGNRTKELYKEHVVGSEDVLDFSKVKVVGVKDRCAALVSQMNEGVGNNNRRQGVFGNAWNMPQNIVDQGGEMIYNIYDEGFSKDMSPWDIRNKAAEKARAGKPDYSKVKVGDVIGINNYFTSHMQEVVDTGTTYNSHVGIVTDIVNGVPIVSHQIGNTTRKDKISSLPRGMNVGTITRPKQQQIGTLNIKPKESEYDISEAVGLYGKEYNDNMKTYMKSLAGTADVIDEFYPEVDTDALQRLSIAVLGRETSFMNDSGEEKPWEKVGKKIMNHDRGRDSSKLIKMKVDTLTLQEKNLLGIHSTADLDDPHKAGIAVMFVLARNYDYFKKLAKTYPELGINEQDIFSLTALSYNQGMHRLKSFGFNNEGQMNPRELESLRAMQNDERNYDVSSTNWRYAPKLVDKMFKPNNENKETAGFDFNNSIYQGSRKLASDAAALVTIATDVDGHESYVHSALKYNSKIKKKNDTNK